MTETETAILPKFLQEGDKIAIVATARKVSPEEIQPSIDLFESWGLEVVVDPDLYAEENQFAGGDGIRAENLQRALDDTEIKAIVCARGGYGTVRIIDRLDFAEFVKHPKWVVGYSDVTVLHSHIHGHFGISTLHATMPLNISRESLTMEHPSTETLRKAFFGELERYGDTQLLSGKNSMNREGDAEGVLVGGNLSMLYSLCGSASDIDTVGKILFIEDLDEYLYHVDRMMQNLKRTGKLFGLKALMVGAMSDMHDNAVPFGKTAEEIVVDAVKDYDFPVIFCDDFGHVGIRNQALYLGRKIRLHVEEGKNELTFV